VVGLTSLDRYRDVGLLITRLGFGLGFLYFHGWPKLAGGPRGWARTGEAMEHLGVSGGYEFFGLLAGLGEGLGGLLLALGLFFRPAALWLLAVMVVATFEQYSRPMPAPEHALKNAFLFAGLFLIGAGRYSLDALRSRRRA
jgi:putative oxidoreductase